MTEVELLRRELEKSNAEREQYRRLYMDMLEKQETQQRLAANVFRRVALGDHAHPA